jgi:hypothetical protein
VEVQNSPLQLILGLKPFNVFSQNFSKITLFFRVFTPSGKINFVQNRLGVLPGRFDGFFLLSKIQIDLSCFTFEGWAGGSKLVSLIGRNKALELLLTCRAVNAEEASRIGNPLREFWVRNWCFFDPSLHLFDHQLRPNSKRRKKCFYDIK